jgi:transposase-like protein
MSEDKTVSFKPPGQIDDPLTEVLRAGARQLLEQAVEAELEAFLAAYADLKTEDGRQRLVRHGHGPERDVLTGIGPVPVRRAKARDRGASGDQPRIRFTSNILPRFARRTRSLDAVLPVLYLRGLSSGDFQEALSALMGERAPALSPQVLGRLKADWQDDYERWQQRGLTGRGYVYLWADGVYLQGRLEDEHQCILVLIGATAEGHKELLGFQAGFRESAQSWRELLADLKGRGLTIAPKLAVGDGAMGFWKALEELFPGVRQQRCWVHKTANVLNKLPKSRQNQAKADVQAIWMADSRADAETALATFEAKYGTKYPNAVACLTKDRKALLAFYDFPAEQWQHVRTTDEMDKRFLRCRGMILKARATSWRRAAQRLQAPPGCLIRALPI